MSVLNTPESIELFLFAICPFAQRVHMSLIHSELPFEKKILDPENIPDDFSLISPLGNVPVLRVNKTEFIFESAVINDYIAQISPIKMEPEDEIKRAKMRSWSEYSTSCMGMMIQVLKSEDEVTFKQNNIMLVDKFQVISKQIENNGPFFYGDLYTSIDSSYAPLFFRMQTLNNLFKLFSLAGLPENVAQWMQALLHSYALKKSIIGDFPDIYRKYISKIAAGKFIDQHIQEI